MCVQVRVTKEELYTTALIAHAYGGSGLSAFNFIYTRPYFDLPWLGSGFTVRVRVRVGVRVRVRVRCAS